MCRKAVDKIEQLADLRAQLVWHFIGPLQSNKSRAVAEAFDWVHSVDSLKLAQRLSAAPWPRCRRCRSACKSTSVARQARAVSRPPSCPRFRRGRARPAAACSLRGLMQHPRAGQRRPMPRRLAALLQPGMDTLSMGMSDDLEAAISGRVLPGCAWARRCSARGHKKSPPKRAFAEAGREP